MREFSLYFHVPYCRKKCLYCDFFSAGSKIADYPLLVQAMLNELRSRRDEVIRGVEDKAVSVYLGGGTPSLLPEREFLNLMHGIYEIVGESYFAGDCEITIEANPDDVTPENIRAWKEGGVNRVSVGIQSFNDRLLKRIGRGHTGECAFNALRMLMENFDNVNGDLIFGLPEQSLSDLSKDIDIITSLQPQHISIYSLMYEDGTALTALRDVGRVEETTEEESLRMFSLLQDSLSKAGYRQYEISNYALPGYESLHNSGYWAGRKYLGIGPSAHSYDGKTMRRFNPNDLKGYLNFFSKYATSEGWRKHFFLEENLTDKELAEEMIMLRLRTAEGLSLSEYEERFGYAARLNLEAVAYRYLKPGHIKLCSNNILSLTKSGIMISDSIISSLLPE